MYLRHGNVETTSSITLYSQSAKFDTIDTTSDTDMVFNRNGTEFFKLGTGYETTNGAPTNLLNVDSSAGVSSGWMFANAFANRSNDTNTEFRGAISGGSGWGKIYMLYEHISENLCFYTDLHLTQPQKMYLLKETGKSNYIFSENIAGVNHLKIYNEDPNGDIRIYANSGIRFFITNTQVSVPAPYTLEGDLVDASDFIKKYDIKSISHNFTDIVKQIEPKTFKMNDEKEIGITKNHLGFIADEIMEAIPPEWENIVMVDNEGIKTLSYVKLSVVSWGAIRELIDENITMKNQIQHLESSVYELQEAVKELLKPKPNSKAPAKSKPEYI